MVSFSNVWVLPTIAKKAACRGEFRHHGRRGLKSPLQGRSDSAGSDDSPESKATTAGILATPLGPHSLVDTIDEFVMRTDSAANHGEFGYLRVDDSKS